jgi:4-hydroxy-tetrahydrodipicolinate reductase
MNIIIGGALGFMGRELTALATANGDTVVCGVDKAYQGQETAFPIVNEYQNIAADADVLIDFSRADALPELLVYAEKAKIPLVLCATGYEVAELESIARAAQTMPILQSANMSLGIAILRRLAVDAARVLGDGYDVEIVEKHHRRKLDSPSGTALMLYESIRQEKDGKANAVYGRQGRAKARTDTEIGLHAVRGGTVVGEHEVGFYGNGEQVLLTHRAENRTLFAQGALRAAHFLEEKPAGRYTMEDMVGEMLS